MLKATAHHFCASSSIKPIDGMFSLEIELLEHGKSIPSGKSDIGKITVFNDRAIERLCCGVGLCLFEDVDCRKRDSKWICPDSAARGAAHLLENSQVPLARRLLAGNPSASRMVSRHAI
ncbi:hypothetical protein AAFG13_37920 [Bradyrhizobium sp. B124]|uniref:hypothetical protein n=1 Tax=Bradyrhizobium sp. B124 TaxID=3140245 RepID=UPI003182F471